MGGIHTAGSVQPIDAFADRFGKLAHTKSALHLIYNQPMPRELLREMTAFCVQERLKESFMEYPRFRSVNAKIWIFYGFHFLPFPDLDGTLKMQHYDVFFRFGGCMVI